MSRVFDRQTQPAHRQGKDQFTQNESDIADKFVAIISGSHKLPTKSEVIVTVKTQDVLFDFLCFSKTLRKQFLSINLIEPNSSLLHLNYYFLSFGELAY